jgi:hypothetical protein
MSQCHLSTTGTDQVFNPDFRGERLNGKFREPQHGFGAPLCTVRLHLRNAKNTSLSRTDIVSDTVYKGEVLPHICFHSVSTAC